jgi:hypothetical protein
VWVTGITGIIILVAIAVFLGWVSERQRRKLKTLRFKTRTPVPVEELVAAHFRDDVDSRERLVYWWKRGASLLGVDATLLRPDDRFDCELAPVAGFLAEDELVDLDELIDELGFAAQRPPGKLETFGEYVQFVVRAEASDRRQRSSGEEGETRGLNT